MTRIRPATVDERAAVRNVIDAGALELDPDRLGSALSADDVLVAEPDGGGVVLGAIVLEGDRIRAVAVRPRRRDQGIGTALVEAAAERRERLIAAFAPELAPFWTACGFEVVEQLEDRWRAVR